MAQFFELHPQDPPQRLIRRSVDILRQGGVKMAVRPGTARIL